MRSLRQHQEQKHAMGSTFHTNRRHAIARILKEQGQRTGIYRRMPSMRFELVAKLLNCQLPIANC
jgi:hypothetical protein